MLAAPAPKLFTRTHGASARYEQVPHEALFRTVRAALAFAYSIQHFPIASSPKLGIQVGGGGRLSNLSPHEKHAQGALIRLAAEQRLKGLDVALTFAYYGAGEIRSAAIHTVAYEMGVILRNRQLGYELVKRQFSRNGIRKTQELLAREFGLTERQVIKLDHQVADEVDRQRLLTEEKLLTMFVNSGIADSL